MRIAFYSRRGGVGRTMACANVAALFATDGVSTAAIDANPDGTLHRYLHSERVLYEPDLVTVRRHAYRGLARTGTIQYINDVSIGSREAEVTCVNLPPNHTVGKFDVVVAVIAPGTSTLEEVVRGMKHVLKINPSTRIIPFSSRERSNSEHDLGDKWFRDVFEAFRQFGADERMVYSCSTPEIPYYAFEHPQLAVERCGINDSFSPARGYGSLYSTLQELR